ncbi:MAG: hypothetical protein J1E58_04960 [Prevotella sp.]|nr:hypothetical protein [Prevotella sp.]
METEFCDEWQDLLDCGRYNSMAELLYCEGYAVRSGVELPKHLQAARVSAFEDMALERVEIMNRAFAGTRISTSSIRSNILTYSGRDKEQQYERELQAKETRISELQVDNARLRSENKRLRTEENGAAYQKMVKNLTDKIVTGQLDATQSSHIQMMIYEVFPGLSAKENLAKTVSAAFAERQRREHPAISLNLAQNQYEGPVETVNNTLDLNKLSSQKRLECNE